MTAAEWLNQTFYGLDAWFFGLTNDLLNICPFLRHVARFISYFGDSGIFFIALTVILLVFRKTRKIGLVLAFGLLFNLILNNYILKYSFARPRPYDTVELFETYWTTHSGIVMHSYSFPSGHTSMAAAIGVGLFLTMNKKYSWAFLLIPLLMAWSRVALFVHYPSDVLFGMISGSLSAVGAFFTAKLVLKIKFIDNLCTGDKLF